MTICPPLPKAEMAVFDELPPVARDLLNDALLPVPSEIVRRLLDMGLPAEHAVKRAIWLVGTFGTEAALAMARNRD